MNKLQPQDKVEDVYIQTVDFLNELLRNNPDLLDNPDLVDKPEVLNLMKTVLDSLPAWKIFERLYQPDQLLLERLNDYELWYVSRTDEDPGQLMEEIAFLAFRCLIGHDSIKSGQSEGPQHDLIITGSSHLWRLLIETLHLPVEGRKILIEAKNTDDKIDDAQFSRLCFILEHKFQNQCHLGVFFSRERATGFPEPGTSQQRVLRDARATQILFHAMTRKYVVLLNHDDILRLGEVGSLPRLLEARIRDIEDRLGTEVDFNTDWKETDTLPTHLRKYIS